MKRVDGLYGIYKDKGKAPIVNLAKNWLIVNSLRMVMTSCSWAKMEILLLEYLVDQKNIRCL